MWLPSLTLTLLSSSILVPPSLCAPPQVADPSTLAMPPIHVPICRREPGGFDLYICARLLSALKNLPYYKVREIWGEYERGEGHLPAVFSFEDRQQRSCHLSMDLYEPGVPVTATERFSLQEEQTDLNNIYFECLRAKGVGGFNRIGFLGNVAALLGPRLDSKSPWLAHFKGMAANGTDSDTVHTIDLTPFADT
ncbi:MAG: hypothetical protein LQ338_004780 [Usnochroma carphineum]|nr:MAG: hypothetical protein LQ338_004780 [Usnochroma carphineum]